MPSTVSIFAPSAFAAGTRQLLTNFPLIKTEHVPHSPAPHPSLVPVKSKSSLRKSNNR